jgi:aminobenzoyl-glutamate utilization protein B
MCYIKLLLLVLLFGFKQVKAQNEKPALNTRTEAWKAEVMKSLDGKSKTAQEMVDMVFSFSELGFQETETSAYLTGILQKNGFKIEKGIGGIPTAWMAKWGAGKPVIALGAILTVFPKLRKSRVLLIKNPLWKMRRVMARGITRACRW